MTENYLSRELHDHVNTITTSVSQGTEPVIRIEMHVDRQTLTQIEEAIIQETLQLTQFNKSLAAKHLGLTRFSLDRRLKKLVEE